MLNNTKLDIFSFFPAFSNLSRLTSCTLTSSVPSGESSRTGSSREVCRVSIIWLPQCTCNGQGLRWAELTRKCYAIGSAFYGVSKPLDWSWSTALQGRVTASWNRRWQMLTASTHSAGSTRDTDTQHATGHRCAHMSRQCEWLETKKWGKKVGAVFLQWTFFPLLFLVTLGS